MSTITTKSFASVSQARKVAKLMRDKGFTYVFQTGKLVYWTI